MPGLHPKLSQLIRDDRVRRGEFDACTQVNFGARRRRACRFSTPAWAQYTFHSFDGPNSTAGTTANGINNNGQIVGFSVDNLDNVTNWWRNTNGTFNILNLPAGSFANGIHTTPTVVGQNGATAYSYTGSTLTALPNVNGTTTSQLALGVNDSGWIVGQYTDSNTGTSPGFVYNGANFTALKPVVNATNTNWDSSTTWRPRPI